MSTEKTGAPPGTLIYSGEKRSGPVKITVIEYNELEYSETEVDVIDENISHVTKGKVKWINIDGVHKVEIVAALGKYFSIHPLTLEDIVSTNQRPKFEEYDNYVIAIMKMIYYDNQLLSEQLSLILRKGIVITFQEVQNGDAFDMIRNRLRQNKGRIRKAGADYLAYALMDAIVDWYFTVLEKIGDHIVILEEELIRDPKKETLIQIHHLKRQIIFLRKAVWPLRELINNIERSENNLFHETTALYLRDVHDHTIRVIDTVETYRDLLSGMMDIYLSSVSHKMNEVMKVLTIISTIFIPVTFIAGVYGMNFDYMPELRSKWGYIGVWIVMLAIMLSMVFYFRRKKWM